LAHSANDCGALRRFRPPDALAPKGGVGLRAAPAAERFALSSLSRHGCVVALGGVCISCEWHGPVCAVDNSKGVTHRTHQPAVTRSGTPKAG